MNQPWKIEMTISKRESRRKIIIKKENSTNRYVFSTSQIGIFPTFTETTATIFKINENIANQAYERDCLDYLESGLEIEDTYDFINQFLLGNAKNNINYMKRS